MNKGVFITGTGTDVGKTYLSALILKDKKDKGINAGYFKAALSGAPMIDGKLVPEDAKYVCDIAGLNEDPSSFVPYIYEFAASPHLSSIKDKTLIEMSFIKDTFETLSSKYDYIVAEGSGGIICPLRLDGEKIMLTDVIKMTGFPIIIVSRSGLGSINETLLTVEYARSEGLEIHGIIMNRFKAGDIIHEDNKRVIEKLTGLPVIACVPENNASENFVI